MEEKGTEEKREKLVWKLTTNGMEMKGEDEKDGRDKPPSYVFLPNKNKESVNHEDIYFVFQINDSVTAVNRLNIRGCLHVN